MSLMTSRWVHLQHSLRLTSVESQLEGRVLGGPILCGKYGHRHMCEHNNTQCCKVNYLTEQPNITHWSSPQPVSHCCLCEYLGFDGLSWFLFTLAYSYLGISSVDAFDWSDRICDLCLRVFRLPPHVVSKSHVTTNLWKLFDTVIFTRPHMPWGAKHTFLDSFY